MQTSMKDLWGFRLLWPLMAQWLPTDFHIATFLLCRKKFPFADLETWGKAKSEHRSCGWAVLSIMLPAKNGRKTRVQHKVSVAWRSINSTVHPGISPLSFYSQPRKVRCGLLTVQGLWLERRLSSESLHAVDLGSRGRHSAAFVSAFPASSVPLLA